MDQSLADLQLVTEFSRFSRIYVDGQGRFWQEIQPPVTFEAEKRGITALPCAAICTKNVSRIHAGCGACRLRRVMKGDLPNRFRVRPYTAWIRVDRRFRKLKDMLVSFLLPIVEVLWS